LARCKELGIGAVAICDHNVFEAHRSAAALASDIIIVPAMEITSDGGHILGLGIAAPVARDLTVRETIESIHAAGGIAIAPHPFRAWSGLGEDNVRSNGFDAIETVNGRSKKAGNLAAKRLAKKLCLPAIGGSDAHRTDAVGRAYTELPDSCRSSDDVIRAIMERRCRAFGTGHSTSRSIWSGAVGIARWFRRGCRRM